MYLYFCSLFCVIFFCYIDSSLQRRGAVPLSAIVCISYRLGLPGIWLMCLSLPFLVIPKAHIISGTLVVLRWHNFSHSISRFFIYLLYYILWLVRYYLLVPPNQFEGIFFSFIVHSHYKWSVALYFSISLESKVLENSNSLYLCFLFWLVFIQFLYYFSQSNIPLVGSFCVFCFFGF